MATCHVCLGSDRTCEECSGRGEIRHHRCPASQTDAFSREVLTMQGMVRHNGVLPAPGSWGEQPSKLMKLIDLASMEQGKLDAAKERSR